MEKLLELRREYLQEVVARGGGQAREYLEEVAMASRGECREVERGEFRAEVDESKRPRKARWGVSSKRGVNQGKLAVITISQDIRKLPNGSYRVLQIPMILLVHCYSLPNETFVQPYQEYSIFRLAPIDRQPTSAKSKSSYCPEISLIVNVLKQDSFF